MAEYIRREDALEAFDEWIETTGAIPKGTSYYHECRGCIEDAPAADVAPVVHGHWITSHDNWTVCSECKALGSPQWKGCPVCLARMDGE